MEHYIHLVYSSLSSPERKGTPAAKTSLMSKKRDEKSKERSLINKWGLAIRYLEKLHLSKSSPGSNTKEPTASIIPSNSKIATRIEDTELIRCCEKDLHKTSYFQGHLSRCVRTRTIFHVGVLHDFFVSK
jgi:hypothetical protein